MEKEKTIEIKQGTFGDGSLQIRQETPKKTPVITILYRIGCVLLIILSLCFIAFNIVFDYNEIDGTSMQPTYNYPNEKEQDFAYYSSFFKHSYNDVIIAQTERLVIKRLIALEGDTFSLKKQTDGFYHIFVNDVMQDESYLLDLSHNEHLFNKIKNKYENDWVKKVDVSFNNDSLSFTIPKGYSFYLGDNRLESIDCASYGPVENERILYKVIFVVPYEENLITYWWKRIFN